MINGNNNIYREPTETDLEGYKAFNEDIAAAITPDERIAALEAQNKSLQEQIDLLVSGVTT